MKKITIFTMQMKTPGGIERLVATLAKMWSREYEVEVVANYGSARDKLAFSLPEKVKVTYLSRYQPAEVSMKKLILGFLWHKIPRELVRRIGIRREQRKVFHKYCGKLQTDYIITERAVYSKLVGKYYHGGAVKIASDHNFHQNNRKYIRALVRSVKGFDALVLATRELRDFYAPLVGEVKCYEIPNPLPVVPTKKAELKGYNLLAVGRLVTEKDFETLIRVMAMVHAKEPRARLTIVGEGPERGRIENVIRECGLEEVVTMTGALSAGEIEKYYYESAVLVMTSVTEAFGLVLTEAMSYGVPCVALERASGARAQLSNGVGVLAKTPKEMAERIVELLRDARLREKYQKMEERAVVRYTLEGVEKEWEKVLEG